MTFAVRAPLLEVPLERDEGEYAYIAWRLGHGELPYRDWVDQKPPGVFWTYRLALALPIDPIPAVHGVAAAFAAASAVALFCLARGFTNEGWAAASAVAFALLSADPAVQGTAANTEVFMSFPLILAQIAFFAAAAEGRGRVPWSLACGALMAVAVAFKQVAAVNAVLLVTLYPAVAPGTRRLQRAAAFAGWSAVAGAAVWGGVALFFFSQHGLRELLSDVFMHNLEYSNALPWSLRVGALESALAALAPSQAAVWALSVAGLVALRRSGRTALLVFLAGWLLTAGVGVSASGYFFPHYFQQLLPPLALTAALGAERVACARAWSGAPRAARIAFVCVALLALPAISLYPFLTRYTPAEAARKIYPTNYFAEMPALAARIAASTRPEDRVFVFGAEPELLFYARRVSASRYIFLFPLYGPYANALERQQAAAEEVSRARPAAIVMHPSNLFSLPGSERFLTRWTEAYVREGYRADAFLAVDPAGGAELVVGAGDRPPAVGFGREPVAGLYLRVPEGGP